MAEESRCIKLKSVSKLLIIFLFIPLVGIHVNAQTLSTPKGERLKTLATKHNLLIGGSSDLNNNDVIEEAIIKTEFNILTPENCLKPYNTQPKENLFDFTYTDNFVKFCKTNNINVHGHMLIGRDSYMPKWMLNPDLTGLQLKEILINHIKTVMGRYKKGSPYGEIKFWDVFNEVNYFQKEPYHSVFEKIGKNSDGDFLYWEIAFKTARETDPDCILIWNEDNIEYDEAKAEQLYQSIKRLKAKGIPIDAVGFQCHIGWQGDTTHIPDKEYLIKTFQKFTDLGLYIVVSEMDVPDNLDCGDIYGRILSVALAQPKCIIFQTWNVLDKYSWRIKENTGMVLFDGEYNAKSTYYSVQKVLNETPINNDRKISGTK
jgi:endo-1,4-beta-xylanase